MAKPLLERHTIYDTAIDIVNDQGADNLSIRRLTSELSCSPNTIYAQVGNRDELVDGLLKYFFASHFVNGFCDLRHARQKYQNGTLLTVDRNMFQ